MPIKKYNFKTPAPSTIQRLEELKFFITHSSLVSLLPQQPITRENFMESICDTVGLTKQQKTDIMFLVSNVNHRNLTPPKLHLAVAIHYLQMPVRPICENTKLMTVKTYYKKLQEYENAGAYDLAPMLDENTHSAVVSFNFGLEQFLKKMCPISSAKGLLNYATNQF